jgi:hypothetical protein
VHISRILFVVVALVELSVGIFHVDATVAGETTTGKPLAISTFYVFQ